MKRSGNSEAFERDVTIYQVRTLVRITRNKNLEGIETKRSSDLNKSVRPELGPIPTGYLIDPYPQACQSTPAHTHE